MGKRKKLTEVEQFYVEQNVKTVSLEDMAKKLDCTKATLAPFYAPPVVNEAPPTPAVEAVAAPEASKPIKSDASTVAQVFPPGMVRNSFARKRNAIVMTPEVSAQTDEIRQRTAKRRLNPKQIHKPYGD